MKILVINAGSSSLKFQLINMDNGDVLAKGLCERIGIDGRLKYAPKGGEEIKVEIPMPTHAEATRATIDYLVSKEHGVIASMDEISAVGHRIVHGGEKLTRALLVTDEVKAELEKVIPLAPLHNPAHLIGINACQEVMPNIPHVVVFDTAFHQTMPEKAYLYALPYKYYEQYAIRRYGFHGTSHRYVSGRAAAMLGRPAEELKIITCHLGNGSSISAVQGGKVIDTSMGFTPLAGLPMGSRTGDIDPAIIPFIMKHENMDPDTLNNMINKDSGVLGVSGISADFRDLESEAAKGHHLSQVALDMFEYSVLKWIGAYSAAMSGVDAIVFTAGVGENNIALRERVIGKLGYLGAAIDPVKNNTRGVEADVSADGAKVRTLVIPTNEELVIAQDTMAIAESLK